MPTVEFYKQRADQCQRDAEAADLANVRDRHLTSRDVWLEMADRVERTTQGRVEQAAEKSAFSFP